METLLIHIGYHKTGTTWLQKELFNEKSNVFSRLTEVDTRKGLLSFTFFFGSDGYILSPFNDNKEEIQKAFALILNKKRNDNKVFVISNERLNGHFLSGGFDSKIIANRINNNFPNAKIFICIREQKSLILSSYFQYLQRGGILSIKKYLHIYNKDFKVPAFSPNHFNFNPLIKEYYSLFGKENVLVLPYEMFKNTPKEFIEQIGDFVNKEIIIDENKFSIKHNIKPNPFILYTFRRLNLFKFSSAHNYYSSLSNRYTKYMSFKIFNFLNKRILSKRLNTKVKTKLSNYINNWVKDRYLKPNIELSKLIDIDLSKYGYH